MPWTPADADQHIKCRDDKERQIWASAANAALKQYGDEGRAIRVANSAVTKHRAGGHEAALAIPAVFALPMGDNVVAPFEEINLGRYWKELIRVGKWKLSPANTVLDVTPERMARWIDTFYKMKADGVKVFVPEGHSRKATENKGFVEDMKIEGNSLYALIDIPIAEVAQKIGQTIREVSICVVRNIKGTTGKDDRKDYGEGIEHVALTPVPVIPNQENFKIAASRDDGGEDMIYVFTASRLSGYQELDMGKGNGKVSFKPWDAGTVRRDAASGNDMLALIPPTIADAVKAMHGPDDIPKDECSLPHHWNDGTLSAGGVRNALARLTQTSLPSGVSAESVKEHLEGHMNQIQAAQRREEERGGKAMDFAKIKEKFGLADDVTEETWMDVVLAKIADATASATATKTQIDAMAKKLADLEKVEGKDKVDEKVEDELDKNPKVRAMAEKIATLEKESADRRLAASRVRIDGLMASGRINDSIKADLTEAIPAEFSKDAWDEPAVGIVEAKIAAYEALPANCAVPLDDLTAAELVRLRSETVSEKDADVNEAKLDKMIDERLKRSGKGTLADDK